MEEISYTFRDNELRLTKADGSIVLFFFNPRDRNHFAMLEDFQDVSKLERFVVLLATDDNTAFSNYLETR